MYAYKPSYATLSTEMIQTMNLAKGVVASTLCSLQELKKTKGEKYY